MKRNFFSPPHTTGKVIGRCSSASIETGMTVGKLIHERYILTPQHVYIIMLYIRLCTNTYIIPINLFQSMIYQLDICITVYYVFIIFWLLLKAAAAHILSLKTFLYKFCFCYDAFTSMLNLFFFAFFFSIFTRKQSSVFFLFVVLLELKQQLELW